MWKSILYAGVLVQERKDLPVFRLSQTSPSCFGLPFLMWMLWLGRVRS